MRLALLSATLLVMGCGRFGFTELHVLAHHAGASDDGGSTNDIEILDGSIATPQPARDGSTTASSSPSGMEGDAAVGEGGTISGGGAGGSPGPTIVSDLTTAPIASGLDQSCVVRKNGDVACWGFDGNGERGDGPVVTVSESVPSRLSQKDCGPLLGVDTGFVHVCGLASDHSAWCWGDNSYGQLGDPAPAAASAPLAVTGGLAFDALSVGADHACAIDNKGDAWCWGRAANGRLGSGDNTDQPSPVRVAGGLKFDAVASGSAHSCAVERVTHFIFCWGHGGSGRLGAGDQIPQGMPVQVVSDLTYRSVDAGTDFTCALTLDDRAFCWGAGGEGQLGNGAQGGAFTPVAVSGGLHFRMLTVSGETSKGFAPSPHACGLTPDGIAYCWGSNQYGQLGAGDASLASTSEPVRVDQTASGPFVSIAAGFGFTCAIDTADATWCWGFDGTGELGTGPGRQDSQAPLRVILP